MTESFSQLFHKALRGARSELRKETAGDGGLLGEIQKCNLDREFSDDEPPSEKPKDKKK